MVMQTLHGGAVALAPGLGRAAPDVDITKARSTDAERKR